MTISDSIRERLGAALKDGEADDAEAIVLEALGAGADPLEVIHEVMIPTLEQVGVDFQNGDIFVPELLMTGEAAEKVSKHLEAAIEAAGKASASPGTVVIGTIKGDIHDIGKNIVSTMLRAHGFKVVDLGRDVSPSAFVDAAKANNANIVGMASLMTTTRPMIASTISLFSELGLRDSYKLIVGGGSITRDWADAVGADGYAKDATTAVELCKQLVA